MPPVMIRKSFVAIVLTLSFLLAFDSTAMRHKPQYPQCEIAADFKAQGHCDSFGLCVKPKFVFACSLENQNVGDDEASPGKGNAINNQDSMDVSS